MSQELLNAVERGNLEAVKTLLHDPKTNINHKGKLEKHFDYSVYGFSINEATPLVAALLNKHWDIAKELILAGAKLDSRKKAKSKVRYKLEALSKLGYICATWKLREIPSDIFKLMLPLVHNISPTVTLDSNMGVNQTVHLLTITPYGKNKDLDFQTAYWVYHEAFIRGEKDNLMHLSRYFPNLHISTDSLSSYLANREINVEYATKASQCLEILTTKSKNELAELQRFIDAKTLYSITKAFFPRKFVKAVRHAKPESLATLFAQLQTLLRKKLPLLAEPVDLRDLINRDDTFLLLCMMHGINDKDEYPVAIILALILEQHQKTIINNSAEPIFNDQQRKRLFDILVKFTNMSPEKKLKIVDAIDMEDRIARLEEKMQEMAKREVELLTIVDGLLQQVDRLQANVKVNQSPRLFK